MTIKRKIYLTLFLLALLPLAMIATVSAYLSEQALKQEIVSHYVDLTQSKASAISQALNNRINETRLLSRHPAVIKALKARKQSYEGRDRAVVMKEIHHADKEWIDNKPESRTIAALYESPLSRVLIEMQSRASGAYAEMFVTDLMGANAGMSSPPSDYYQADEYWWQATSKLSQTGAFLDDRGYDDSSNSIVIGVVVPVYELGEFLGVFKINFKAKSILNIIQQSDSTSGESLGLVRSDGGLVVSSNTEAIETLAADAEIINALHSKNWWEVSHDGVEFLHAYAAVEHSFKKRVVQDGMRGVTGEGVQNVRWLVVSEIERDVAFVALQNLRQSSLFFAGFALLLAAIFGFLLSRSIVRPLAKLSKGSKALGSGDLEHQVNIQQNDELGDLAKSFDDMATNLQETMVSKETLEKVIQERDVAQNRVDADKKLQTVIKRMQSDFSFNSDPTVICQSLLHDLLELTDSQYGLVGETRKDTQGKPFLITYALSKLAWNDETMKLYKQAQDVGFEFHELDNLFGRVVTTGKPVISNDPEHDPNSGGLPEGHPSIDAFLGIPVYFGGHLVGEIGLANRKGGYNQEVLDYLAPLTASFGQIIAARQTLVAKESAEMALVNLTKIRQPEQE